MALKDQINAKFDPVKISKIIGINLPDWAGNCYAIASMCIKHNIVAGTKRYGHWTGPVNPKSMFYRKKRALGFANHGWVELKNGKIFDPTRWVFECAKPYIYIGENDHYDVGGNMFREENRTIPPKYKPSTNQVKLKLNNVTQNFVKFLLNDDRMEDVYSMDQIFWLANATPKEMGEFARSIYKGLEKSGNRAFIPLDNWNLIMK